MSLPIEKAKITKAPVVCVSWGNVLFTFACSDTRKSHIRDQVLVFGGIQGRSRELSSRAVVWNSVVASNSKSISLASSCLQCGSVSDWT